jgi:hypothetical protein
VEGRKKEEGLIGAACASVHVQAGAEIDTRYVRDLHPIFSFVFSVILLVIGNRRVALARFDWLIGQEEKRRRTMMEHVRDPSIHPDVAILDFLFPSKVSDARVRMPRQDPACVTRSIDRHRHAATRRVREAAQTDLASWVVHWSVFRKKRELRITPADRHRC